jgi:hypothetical protein
MPSFATLSVFATVAFSALTSAVPVASPAGVSVPAVARADVLSASAILTNLKTTITPLAGQLCRFLYLSECLYIKINGRLVAAMDAGDATPDNVAPVVNKITVALTTAIGQVKDLNGQPKDVVMAGNAPGETVPLQNVAKLVSDVLFVSSIYFVPNTRTDAGSVQLLIPTLAGLLKIVGPGGDLDPILGPVG